MQLLYCKQQPPPLQLPVSIASASFSFQCLATLSARGSSGLGALSSAWMLHKHTRNQSAQAASTENYNQHNHHRDIAWHTVHNSQESACRHMPVLRAALPWHRTSSHTHLCTHPRLSLLLSPLPGEVPYIGSQWQQDWLTAPESHPAASAVCPGCVCKQPHTCCTNHMRSHLNKTVRICSAGLHLSFRISKQMRPSLSMLGW